MQFLIIPINLHRRFPLSSDFEMGRTQRSMGGSEAASQPRGPRRDPNQARVASVVPAAAHLAVGGEAPGRSREASGRVREGSGRGREGSGRGREGSGRPRSMRPKSARNVTPSHEVSDAITFTDIERGFNHGQVLHKDNSLKVKAEELAQNKEVGFVTLVVVRAIKICK